MSCFGTIANIVQTSRSAALSFGFVADVEGYRRQEICVETTMLKIMYIKIYI